MPLSEFLRMASRKTGSGQRKPFPADLGSRVSESDNGQIMMQGQPSGAARTSPLPPNTSKARIGKLGGEGDSVPHDVVVPSPDLDSLWLDSLTQPEISGVAPISNGMSSVEKIGSYGQAVSNLLKSGFGLGSGFLGIVSNNNNTGNHSRPDVSFENPAQSRDIRPPNNSSSYRNFSHFARPANLVPDSVKENSSAGKVFKLTLVEGSSSISSGQRVVTKDSCPSENLYQETPVVNDHPSTQTNATESAKGVPCRERIVEHVVASSSVGSGNSADRVSCEQTHNSKRKYRDTEDSECRTEDVGTESAGLEKTTLAGGNGGSKRSRTAQVHNLSERRRRDRINEKMRALQELVPNCNKADKASMLDEAIEYLKTLQLQVQIMSMASGLCMPQMMFPPGMQHMHPAHMQHFSPMGPVGMGIGMGMLDINGGCPVFPLSPLHALRFPASLPANFQRMPSSNFPVYGHPIQGVPFTGQPSHVDSALGLTGLRNGSQNAVTGSSPVLTSGDVTNMNSQLLNCYTEANQLPATDEVLNQSATVQEIKQATNASGLSTMTATTATDISKEPCEQ